MTKSTLIQIAGVLGFIAIGLGAMGAHALEGRLLSAGYLDEWKTAAQYHLLHSLALLAVAAIPRAGSRTPVCYWLWLVGTIIFSGTLYTICLTGISKLGMITPIGGLALMAGWLSLVIKPKQLR